MNATPNNLTELFSKYRFRIPLYQRHYDWEEKQCFALWEDFIRLYDEKNAVHYLGTMIVEGADDDEFLIVDGQQRTTSLMLLMKVLQSACGDSVEAIRNLTHDGDRLRLKPQSGNNECDHFNAVMSEPPSAIKETHSMAKNFRYFNDYVAARFTENTIEEEKVICALSRMQLAFVELDRNSDDCDVPQTIFDKINAEGKDLEVHDLIRNYLFLLAADSTDGSESPSAKQQSLYENEWQNVEREFPDRALRQMSHFFRDYLIVKTGDPSLTSGPQLYSKFKEYLKSEACVGLDFDTVESRTNDIWKHADAWGKVVFCNPLHGNLPDTRNLQSALADFSMVGNSLYYPLAMLLMLDHGSQNHGKLAKIFHTLNKFIVISALTGCQTAFKRKLMGPILSNGDTSVKDWIKDEAKFAEQLKLLWPEDFKPAERIELALLGPSNPDEREEDGADEPGTPSQTGDAVENPEEQHKIHLAKEPSPQPDFYHFTRNVSLFLLLKINEEQMDKEIDTKTMFLEPSHSLEHIMPQTPDNGWEVMDGTFRETHLHSIGNLTLLGKNFNSRVSNKSLTDKEKLYRNSSYAITRQVAADLNSAGLLKAPGKVDAELFRKFVTERAKELAKAAQTVLSF